MYKKILFLVIAIVWVSCSYFNADNKTKAPEPWKALKSEPSLTLEPSDENNVISYNISIKNNYNKTNKSSEVFTDDLIFDQGSLSMDNAELDMSPKYAIRFIEKRGLIAMDGSKLSTSFIENASIQINANSELHLYHEKPLKNTDLNIQGDNVSIYFHHLTFTNINEYIFEPGIISIENRKLQNSNDIDCFPEKQIGIKSFRGGVCLTIN